MNSPSGTNSRTFWPLSLVSDHSSDRLGAGTRPWQVTGADASPPIPGVSVIARTAPRLNSSSPAGSRESPVRFAAHGALSAATIPATTRAG